MRYEPIDRALFESNRKKLVDQLKPKSIVVMLSNDLLPLSGDGRLPFIQHSDFFYLTGVDQPDCAIILMPDFPDEELREVLFIKESNEATLTWEGTKINKEEGADISGIQKVIWYSQFEQFFKNALPHVENIYLDFNENPKHDGAYLLANERFAGKCVSDYPLLNFERLAPILTSQRMIKSPLEIHLIRNAGLITKMGYERVLGFIKPGVWEFEIEAEFGYEFIRNRSKGFAYSPIVASGENACVLHYEENNKQCIDGDLVLLDVAAEYANYKSDVTRTYPVNGKFNKRQREVYQAVLNVKKEAEKLLRPGITLKDYNAEVAKIMEDELIKIRLLNKKDIADQDPQKPLYKKYFMHSTSHHLGLDVHDISNQYKAIKAGMVFTVEPGIYIKEEGIGIRLEDDIFVDKKQNTNLTPDIPIEVDEIEDFMNT
ncbi:MAG: aminopeptidase P N-terminal domain-containing protein [Cyclobacteriaceae bacterium]